LRSNSYYTRYYRLLAICYISQKQKPSARDISRADIHALRHESVDRRNAGSGADIHDEAEAQAEKVPQPPAETSAHEFPHWSHGHYEGCQGQTQEQLWPNLLDHVYKSISEYMLHAVTNLPRACQILLGTSLKGLLAMRITEVIRVSLVSCGSRFPHFDIHPADRVESQLLLRSQGLRSDLDEISYQPHD
jgi:hypothetical protein